MFAVCIILRFPFLSLSHQALSRYTRSIWHLKRRLPYFRIILATKLQFFFENKNIHCRNYILFNRKSQNAHSPETSQGLSERYQRRVFDVTLACILTFAYGKYHSDERQANSAERQDVEKVYHVNA